jgi:hypothetical protein
MIAIVLSVLLAAPPQPDMLLAQGRLGEAEEGYRAWAAQSPTSVDAWLGLCRILRWTGRLLESREAAARAVLLAPQRADAREELARSYAAEALPSEAMSSLPGPAPEDLRADLRRLRGMTLVLSSTASDDTNGISRIAPRLALEVPLPADARLTIAGGMSRVGWGAAATCTSGAGCASGDLSHQLAGLTVVVPSEHVRWGASYVLHQGSGNVEHEAGAAIQVQPIDALGLKLALRHRPLLETADSLSSDENAFHGAGAGGALRPDAVEWVFVNEAKLSLQLAPVRVLYAYGEGRAFYTTDANDGWSVASGVGLDLVGLAGLAWPVQLYGRWDAYFTGFARARTTYFSPSFQDGQSPGLDLRVRFGELLTVGAEGGRTFTLFSAAQGGGWFGGAQLALRLPSLTVALHGQVRDDPWYGSRRLWLSIRTVL